MLIAFLAVNIANLTIWTYNIAKELLTGGAFLMKLDELKEIASRLQGMTAAESQTALRTLLIDVGLDPDNLYQELEMSSRYVDTHQDLSHPDSIMQLHSHTFYEIIACRNNCGAEYLVGAERFRLRKGDIILVPPCVSHRPLLTEKMTAPYIRDVVWVSVEMVNSLRRLFPQEEQHDRSGGYLLRTAGTKWEYLGELIHSGVREAESRAPGWDVAVMGNTVTLMTHLKRAFEDAETIPLQAEKPQLLDRAMAYIEDNLAGRITLEEAARHLFVSESTVRQLFRKKLGVSFYRCVTQRRLIAAKALILKGVLLETVGEQVGFADYSGFYRAFRQEYGISPRQYRKLQNTGETPDPNMQTLFLERKDMG